MLSKTPGEAMKQDYGDITGKLGRPVWWDEVGCPRYAPFKPWMSCDFYAEEAALLRIRCQNCHAKYLVCVSAGERDKRPLQARVQPLTYGDPPRYCCQSGASMTSETIEVVELWAREKGEWRKKSPRSYIAPVRLKQARKQWRASNLRLLKHLLTPSDVLSRKILRGKNASMKESKKDDGPVPVMPRRSQVLKRLAKLGKPPPNLSKLSTFQLARMLYELESGEPG